MKNKWVLRGNGDSIVRGDNAEGYVKDNVRELLKMVASGGTLGDQQAKDLKRRKLITQVSRSFCIICLDFSILCFDFRIGCNIETDWVPKGFQK